MTTQQLLIEAFVEECLEEIQKTKHPENGPFNFGLASADAAVRRVKTIYLEKLKNENDDDGKVF